MWGAATKLVEMREKKPERVKKGEKMMRSSPGGSNRRDVKTEGEGGKTPVSS